MSQDLNSSPHKNSRPARAQAPVVVRTDPVGAGNTRRVLLTVLPAWVLSVVVHAILLALFFLVTVSTGTTETIKEIGVIETKVEDPEPAKDPIGENTDIGLDPTKELNYNLDRLADISVPGEVKPDEAIGLLNAPEGAMVNVPPPLGLGGNVGQGGGIDAPVPGTAAMVGMAGGFPTGFFMPGGPSGRSGATREKMLAEGGGTTESEAAVARGLRWLYNHQGPEGNWSLDNYRGHGRNGRCNCTGFGQKNDVAATAFGLLPFLAAGHTHKTAAKAEGMEKSVMKERRETYGKAVEKGLEYLMKKQGRDGYFGGGMYAHGLATIAVCEAYAMTNDPKVKVAAQKAINFIRAAQADTGGWRYEPRQGGDTSVVGWQLMALKSGQMGGLEVDSAANPTYTKATKWLNSVMTSDGSGYGYVAPQATPTMTAVGALCRQYLGWGPRKPEMIAAVNTLKKTPPGSAGNLYYYYYATQVMHHFGGKAWEEWNPKMRDLLIAKQQKEMNTHADGSWNPAGDSHGGAGGRVMITSLSILTLEVYYRHLPLYRRDLAMGKDVAAN